MEPNVVHIHSSSPPALGEGVAEDDEFGDFGGFSGVSPSGSFTQSDTPVDTRLPDRLGNGIAGFTDFGSEYPCDGSDVEFTRLYSSNIQGSGLGLCLPKKTSLKGEMNQEVDQCHPREGWNFVEREVNFGQIEGETRTYNGDVSHPEPFTKGFVHAARYGGTTTDPGEDCGPFHLKNDFADPASLSNGGPLWGGRCITDTEENSNRADMEEALPTGIIPGITALRSVNCVLLAVDTVGLSNGYSAGSEQEGQGRNLRMGLGLNASVKPSCEVPGLAQKDAGVEDHGKKEGGGLITGAREWESSQVGSRGEYLETGIQDRESIGTDGCSADKDLASFSQVDYPDGLENFGDFSTEELRKAEGENIDNPEDIDFADFSQVESVRKTFVDFSTMLSRESPNMGQFRGFDSLQHREGEGRPDRLASLPGSDSFADFMGAESAPEWDAFGEQDGHRAGGDSWVAFGEEQSAAHSEGSEESWPDGSSSASPVPSSGSPQTSRKASLSVSLTSWLEQLFQNSFPLVQPAEPQDKVLPLGALLQAHGEQQGTAAPWVPRHVWRRLQDVHGALGLQHQWGGSHGNKVLLRSLGIDTRKTPLPSQKKQQVTTSPYAASLVTQEPAKEAVKSNSALEKMSFIAQTLSVSPEKTTPSHNLTQGALPTVQFDWNSSGLMNPLGGTFLHCAPCDHQSPHS